MKNNICLKISAALLLLAFVAMAAFFMAAGLCIMQLIGTIWLLRLAGSILVIMPLVLLFALADWLVHHYAG